MGAYIEVWMTLWVLVDRAVGLVDLHSANSDLAGHDSSKLSAMTSDTQLPPLPTLPQSSGLVKYGPSSCVSVWKSKENHCIMSTNCSSISSEVFSKYNMGLVCIDKAGYPVKHFMGNGSFAKEETFDTLIECDKCLGLDKIPDKVYLKGEVATSRTNIKELKDLAMNMSDQVKRLTNRVFPPAPAPAPSPVPAYDFAAPAPVGIADGPGVTFAPSPPSGNAPPLSPPQAPSKLAPPPEGPLQHLVPPDHKPLQHTIPSVSSNSKPQCPCSKGKCPPGDVMKDWVANCNHQSKLPPQPALVQLIHGRLRRSHRSHCVSDKDTDCADLNDGAEHEKAAFANCCRQVMSNHAAEMYREHAMEMQRSIGAIVDDNGNEYDS